MIKIFLVSFIFISCAGPQKQTAAADCSDDKNCQQLNTCSEAMFYYQQCGRKELDKDNDGVPCDNLCPKG